MSWTQEENGETREVSIIPSLNIEEDFVDKCCDMIRRVAGPNLTYLKEQYVLIGTPCYGGSVTVEYMKSMHRLGRVFDRLGIRYYVRYYETESLIQRARNALMAEMYNKSFTHLMFIDADIGFDPLYMVRLLLAKTPVIAGSYPMKKLNVRGILQADKDDDVRSVLIRTQPMVYTPLAGANADENGFLEVMAAPTGFMLIHKSVPHLLSKICTPYIQNMPEYQNNVGTNRFFDFFKVYVCPKTNILLSEDYGFCMICRDNDIPIMVDTMATLSHTGRHTFMGNLDVYRSTVQ